MRLAFLRQLARVALSYGLVSAICFLLNNALLIGLDTAGEPLWINLSISATCMIIIGFALQSLITFGTALSWHAFRRYAFMMLPNIPFAYGFLWVLNHRLSVPMHFSAPIATTILLIWNAAASAWALHKRSSVT